MDRSEAFSVLRSGPHAGATRRNSIHLLGATLFLLAVSTSCSSPSEVVNDSSFEPLTGNIRAQQAAVALADCLGEAGWDVSVSEHGGWGVEAAIPVEQERLYDEARLKCLEDLDLLTPSVDVDFAQYSYDNNLRVHNCLIENGYSVSEVPDRNVYVQRLLEDPNKENWDPYAEIFADDLARAVFDCPQ